MTDSHWKITSHKSSFVLAEVTLPAILGPPSIYDDITLSSWRMLCKKGNFIQARIFNVESRAVEKRTVSQEQSTIHGRTLYEPLSVIFFDPTTLSDKYWRRWWRHAVVEGRCAWRWNRGSACRLSRRDKAKRGKRKVKHENQ